MRHTPPPVPVLDEARRQAHELFTSLREGRHGAVSRVAPYFGKPEQTGPRDAQHVVAREHGFACWSELLERAHEAALEAGSREALSMTFLRLVAGLYAAIGIEFPWLKAGALLESHPEIGAANIYTAVAVGDCNRVRQYLDADPSLVHRQGGYYDWEPLMYAAYSRLPGADTLAVARLLIEAGADPNPYFMWGGQYRFTALTGVFGEGENGPNQQPAHADCEAFARLLLEAGADPNDSQALYNRMFTEGSACLEMLLNYGLAGDAMNNWYFQRDGKFEPNPQSTLHYQLMFAIRHGRADRVRMIVAPGFPAVNQPAEGRTPFELAVVVGEPEIADFLAAHGAQRVRMNEPDRFVGACLSADASLAGTLSAAQPGLLEEVRRAYPEMLTEAAGNDKRNAVALIIDLGFDVNRLTHKTALHQAAWQGHLDMVRLLIEKGADPKIRDRNHFASPLGWAQHNGQKAVAEFLAQCEMDLFTAVGLEHIEKIKAVLEKDPRQLNVAFRAIRPESHHDSPMDWMTPLAFAVCHDHVLAARVLIEHGADRKVRNSQGRCLEDIVRDQGNPDLVALFT